MVATAIGSPHGAAWDPADDKVAHKLHEASNSEVPERDSIPVLEQDDVEEIKHTDKANPDAVVELRHLAVKFDGKRRSLVAPPVALRRSTTIAVPFAMPVKPLFGNEQEEEVETSTVGELPMPTLTRSKSCPERAAAMEAIENRATRFRFTTAASARESVRQMYSYLLHDFPKDGEQKGEAKVKMGPAWRRMQMYLDREGLRCIRTSLVRKKQKEIRIALDDLLGAARESTTSEVIVHYMKQGKGKNEEKLKRRYRQLELKFKTTEAADLWVRAFQLLVKWQARVPIHRTRKIKVVVNPHSGKRRGLQIWQKWKPVFQLAGIQCDMETTQYSGHARDIGKTLDLSAKYEAVVFVGGDGTVNEFMNGIFARDEDEWRNLVATTPVSLISAGTDNAFGLGVGVPTHEAAVYCIIKRKIRPLDVVTCETDDADGSKRREFACCGVSYGIGGDIAMESEKTRWLGVHRYKWLKVKRTVFAPRPHECTIKYVLSDTIPTDENGKQVLKTYYEVMDENAHDQHHVEMCSVYDDYHLGKRWNGDASAIFSPANAERYGGRWQEEQADYQTVGASNVYFETEYYHPSDGNMDLIVCRKGTVGQTADVALKYAFGDYLESDLVSYHKIKALIIDQKVNDPINVDGEVFSGTGQFRIEVVPQLLNVLSEK
ncbi:hypothetical protein Poli38472_005646 [Pythium oligandrum]|uniref:DAGKc domain-containing protein n=1 Tax=Pythium oligandrum TaxID=41045 RepID=A0A8K1FLU2_PYTOL|nr:hypothetical protein Poli38472_005646 [Pythium oligandrum]|eukprot:TMW63028.1 hypothetical protein Poli38472_005646 [Pythium oligandrum]